jgi:hypothetical protein
MRLSRRKQPPRRQDPGAGAEQTSKSKRRDTHGLHCSTRRRRRARGGFLVGHEGIVLSPPGVTGEDADDETVTSGGAAGPSQLP